MNVTVIGAGYVGLVSAVCLAAKGHHVCCVDNNPVVVQGICDANPHIFEMDLQPLLAEVVSSNRLTAICGLPPSLQQCDLVLVAVGTPSRHGQIDLSSVRAVARSIGEYLRSVDRFLAVVVKSTVVPGTTDSVIRREIEEASGKSVPAFGLGMNPEFLREGCAVEDFMQPDRIVLGYEDQKTLAALRELYSSWNCEKIEVNTRTAELIKYANNVMLATQISAMNELANLASALGGIDIMEVVQGLTLDKRWTPIIDGRRVVPGIVSYLTPGCGFGGSCLPKDVLALSAHGEREGANMRMLRSIIAVNESQPSQVVNILKREVGDLTGRRCLLLGAAFKPDTDDVRQSASIKIAKDLLSNGADVAVYDPIALNNFALALGDDSEQVDFVASWLDAVRTAEIVVVATKWEEFFELRSLPLDGKVVFDARRMFSPADFVRARYLSIGRRID